MSESGEGRGLQISLKWLLIGVPFAGAGLGLLGRSFYRDLNEFRLALLLVTVVAPFLLAVGTIIRLGWRSRRRDLMAWGAFLLIAPFVGFGARMFADHLYGIHGYGVVDNTTLIKQRLPNELTSPWVWDELERRVQSGSLSKAEVDEVVQTLIAHMITTSPQGVSQPLHWEGDFIKLAAQNQLLSQQTLFDLCDAFYGKQPKINRLSRLREGSAQFNLIIDFGNPWGQHSQLPIGLVWTPTKMLVDDRPIRFQTDMAHGTHWSGSCFGSFPPGDHELTVELECAYVSSQFPASMNLGALEPFRWPKPQLKNWQLTVKDIFHVIDNRAVPVNLTTNAADDPLVSQSLSVGRIVILPGENGVCQAILEIVTGDKLSIPVSLDVAAKIDGQTYQFGTFVFAKWPDHSLHSGDELRAQIGILAQGVKSAEVTLTPNPRHVEGNPEVTEIWGKPLVFPNVPVERFDLDEEQP